MIFKIGLERLGDEVVVEMKPDKVSLTPDTNKTDFPTSYFCLSISSIARQVLTDQEDSGEEVTNISSRIYCFK